MNIDFDAMLNGLLSDLISDSCDYLSLTTALGMATI
jgi:hypothetical protein